MTNILQRWSRTKVALGLLGGLALVALVLGMTRDRVTVAHAATTNDPQSGISVTGIGRATVVPDLGVINLAAQVTRPSVSDARDTAARAMDAIRGALKSQGIEDRDIATSGFNIQPQYNYRPDGGSPTINGYMVSNNVTVKVRSIDKVGSVIDATVTAGGNDVRVNGVQFTVDDIEKVSGDARRNAVANARAHAEVLAQAAGVTLGRARMIVEGGSGGSLPPLAVANTAGGKGAGDISTPVSPGESTVTVSVSVVYDLN
ncbi:MAG: DUF541 domain-containing protein [Chloroflexi bacterium]|nr:MAG: DUF541 domain-containing protein [Chloroflexota bacterium]